MYSWRRSGRRIGLATAILVVAASAAGLLRPGSAARADMFFSEDDPIVSIQGIPVSITVGIAASGVAHLQGHVPIVIVVPNGVSAAVVASTHQFFTEDVSIVSAAQAATNGLPGAQGEPLALPAIGSNAVLVFAEVPASGSYVTRLYSNRSATVYGLTNHVMLLSFAVPGGSSTPAPASGPLP